MINLNENKITVNQNGEIKVIDRKKINLSGVKKIVSFNPEEFLVETYLGILLLKGQDLEIIKLDTTEGILLIKGLINGLNYIDSNKNKDTGIISRLFK